MLYKFKSKAAADLIMLEPNGRYVLEVIGKAPGPSGIVLPEDMAAALAALDTAIGHEEAAHHAAVARAKAEGVELPPSEDVPLRQRTQPFIEMLKRSMADNVSIVWGV